MSKTPIPGIPPIPQAWADASERASAHLQKLMQGWQQAQVRTLQAFGQDTGALAEEVGRAGSLPDLMELHVAYLAEEWTRLLQASSQMLGSLLEAQSGWTRQLEAGTGAWLRTTLPDRPAAGTAVLPDVAAAFGPAGMVQAAQAAQAAWVETTRVWMDAINHDLEMAGEAEETTAPAATQATTPRRRAAGTRAAAH